MESARTHTFSYKEKGKNGKFVYRDKDNQEIVDDKAYSGDKEHFNDEKSQHLPNQGPIPVGTWKVTKIEHHEKLGPLTIWLEEKDVKNNYSRNAFRIHGDKIDEKIKHGASEGCIVAKKEIREKIKEGDLVVVETEKEEENQPEDPQKKN